MRALITLPSLGLTLALGLGSAALAQPGERYALLESRDAAAATQNHYLHKKYYGHSEDRAPGGRSGTTRLPAQDGIGIISPDGVGTASPDVRKPVVQPESAVRG
jgi:hypothetical protein